MGFCFDLVVWFFLKILSLLLENRRQTRNAIELKEIILPSLHLEYEIV